MDFARYLPSWLEKARQHPRWTAAGGVAVVLLLVLLRGCFHSEVAADAYYQVKRNDFLVTIVEGGTLEAVNEVVVRNEVEGNSRIIYIVPEGTYVKKGDLLVQLDTADAEEKVNQQEISYEKAKSSFVQAEKDLEIQRSVVQSSIDAAALKVKFAELDLDKFKKGQRLQEERNAHISITTAQAALMLAQDNLDWSEKLFKRGFETKNAVDQGRNNVQDLTLKLEQAKTNLWMLTTFDHPKMLEQDQSDLDEAKKELDRTKAQGEGKLATLQADLITQSNSLALVCQKLNDDKEQLEKSKIYAPQDGLVVYALTHNRFSSQSLIEEGAMVRERQELIKLPDTSQMKVEIKVHESHVNKVHVGQPAFVVLDPLPDERFRAVVSKVAVLPDTQSLFGNPNLKVYKTEVVITDKLPDIKPGVSARAEIVITNIPQALTVPIQAVTTRKGTSVVFRKSGGSAEPVPVQVGMFNTKFIEIASGLKEGDEVLLAPPYDLQEKDLGGAIIGKDDQIPQPQPAASVANLTGPNGAGTNAVASTNGAPPMRPGSAERSPRSGPPGENPGPGDRRRGGDRPGLDRDAMMKRFDKNGDGQLDETERAALRASSGNRGSRNRQPQGPPQ